MFLDAMQESALLDVGQKVQSRYKGGDKWYAGVVSAANNDGTYQIFYEDGDTEARQRRELIKPVDDLDHVVAHDAETFLDLFSELFTASARFQSLRKDQQVLS